MKKSLRKKTLILIVLVVTSLALLSVSLAYMQNKLSLQNYERDMKVELKQINQLLETAKEEELQIKETYDAIYQAKAESVAFMANNDAGFEYTDAQMRETKDVIDVDNYTF